METNARMAEHLKDKLDDLMAVEDKSAAQKEIIRDVVEQLNELLPDLGLRYDEATDSLNKNTDAIQDNIDAVKERARAEAIAEYMKETIKVQIEAEVNQDKAEESFRDLQMKMQEIAEKHGGWDAFLYQYNNNPLSFTDDESITYENYLQAIESVKEATRELATANDEVHFAQMKWMESNGGDTVLNAIDAYKDQFGVELPEIFRKAVEEAYRFGIDLPQNIVDGLNDGSINIEEATAQMNEIITLTDALRNAAEQGINIDQAVAESIHKGDMSISEAVDYVNGMIDLQPAVDGSLRYGTEFDNALSRGMIGNKDTVRKSVEYLAQGAVNVLGSYEQYFAIAGQRAVQAYVEGGINKKGEIHSPSRLTARSGRYLALGALNVLNESNQEYAEAGRMAAEEYNSGFRSLLSGAQNDLRNTSISNVDNTINHNHTGTIHVEGVNSEGDLVGIVDIIIDQLKEEVRT